MKRRTVLLLGLGGLLNLLALLGLLLAFQRFLDGTSIRYLYAALRYTPSLEEFVVRHWPTLLGVGVLLTYLGRGTMPVGRWCHLFKGSQLRPGEMYESFEKHVLARAVPRVSLSAATVPEGGWLGALRDNVRVSRRSLRFDVSAMRFGDSLGVSWRCYHRLRMHELVLTSLPLLGWLLYRAFYRYTPYAEDQALLFQSLVQQCLGDALDELGSAGGLRALTQDELKPVLADLFQRR